MRSIVHLTLHFAVPAVIALAFFRPRWGRAWLIMSATMLIDLDHLLASPVFDPDRCGIGYHPLHSMPLIASYPVAALFRGTRLIGLGLTSHVILDGTDCLWMSLESP